MWALCRLSGAALLLAVTTGLVQAQDQMPWQPNIETAQQIAAQTNRLVLLHFWSTSCQPCKRLEREVFSRADVARALEPNFVMVKLNVEEAPGTARLYGVSSIPTDVIILPNGQLVSQAQCPPAANQYVAQLSQAAAGHYQLARRSMGPAPAAAQPGPASAPPAGPPPAPPAAQAPPPPRQGFSNDRFAEYFPQQASAGPPPGPGAPPQQQMAAAAANAPPATPNMQPPSMQPQPPAGAAPADPQAAMRASYRPQLPAPPQLPPGSPPIGLDGFCPVTLVERQQWAMGTPKFGAIHRGRTYLFLGPEEAKKFMANPDLYSPVLSGNDPVLALDNQMSVPGKREFGVYADNRIFLFADAASRAKFEQNPKRYASEALQAMR